jgi:hypothetical protein
MLSPECSHKAGLQTVITGRPLQFRPVIRGGHAGPVTMGRITRGPPCWTRPRDETTSSQVFVQRHVGRRVSLPVLSPLAQRGWRRHRAKGGVFAFAPTRPDEAAYGQSRSCSTCSGSSSRAGRAGWPVADFLRPDCLQSSSPRSSASLLRPLYTLRHSFYSTSHFTSSCRSRAIHHFCHTHHLHHSNFHCSTSRSHFCSASPPPRFREHDEFEVRPLAADPRLLDLQRATATRVRQFRHLPVES